MTFTQHAWVVNGLKQHLSWHLPSRAVHSEPTLSIIYEICSERHDSRTK